MTPKHIPIYEICGRPGYSQISNYWSGGDVIKIVVYEKTRVTDIGRFFPK